MQIDSRNWKIVKHHVSSMAKHVTIASTHSFDIFLTCISFQHHAISQSSKVHAVDRSNDGDMTRSETRVFHLTMEDVKAQRITSQLKMLVIIIARSLALAKVSLVSSQVLILLISIL